MKKLSKDLQEKGFELNESVIHELKHLQSIDNDGSANNGVDAYLECLDQTTETIIELQEGYEQDPKKVIRILHDLNLFRGTLRNLKASVTYL